MESKEDMKSNQKQQMSKKVGKYVLFMNEDQILGKGQFGVVYRALDDNKKIYAVKMISMAFFKQNPFDSKTKKNAEQLKREIDVMKAAKHKNLVTLYDMQQSPNNLYLFIEYCNGGNLKDYLKYKNKLSQEEAIDIFKQLCEGYEVLNKQNILHRDIKLENVMLHDSTPKLCDFGFGKIVENDVNEPQLQSYKCTPIYAAPQILVNQPYSSKCDVWSMGCMLYEMLFGYRNYPFNARNQVELIENQKIVMDKNLKLPKNDLDPLVVDILLKLLRYHEKDRISWQEIWAHPIFKKKFDEVLDESNILEDSNEVSQSLIQNRKTLQKVQIVEEGKVYKKNKKDKQSSQDKQNTSTDDENLKYMREVQKNEEKQYISSKVDKLILYYRNQGIFASIIMQNFWGVRNEYKLETHIPHQIVYYLGGYYSYMLQLVFDIIHQNCKYDFEGFLKEKDFEIYLQSKAIQVTKQKVNTDFTAAQSLFVDIKKSALSEAQKILQKGEYKNVGQVKDFIAFIQEENTDHNKYLYKLQDLLHQSLTQIDIDSLKNRNSLKGLDSLIIFSGINKIFPVELYDKIDMKLFYEKQLNNKNEKEHLESILSYMKIKKLKSSSDK